jgi:predicted  nucleic acid-binding Zn-ribbon protein
MPSGASNTRIAIFKLLMKVTTPKFERTAGAIRDGANLLKRRRDAAEAIGEFLDAEPATNLRLIDSRIAELTSAQQAAVARVEAAHKAATAVEQQDGHYETLLSEAQEEWQRAEEELDAARRKYERAKRQVQECEEALASLAEQETRPEWQPGTINIVVDHCQYCGGRVPREPIRPGQCFMCGGLHRGVIQPAERATLSAKLSSAQQALHTLDPAHRLATRKVENAKTRVYDLRKQRDERTRSSVPHVGAIADAEKELGEITGELQALESARTSAARIVTMREEIRRLEEQQAELESQHELDSSGLTRIETLVEDLEGILTLIMNRIRPPHWTGRARIDPETFLPVIDGMGFAQRGGGGRSAVSIAYSLTLLTYTLENSDTLLPSLLMIDSPRKNFGASTTDQGLSDRLYEQILDYLKTWSHSRGKGGRPPFQIIIADNDRRADRKRGRATGVRDGVRYHPFTEENGFIRGLKNPHGPFVADQGDLLAGE